MKLNVGRGLRRGGPLPSTPTDPYLGVPPLWTLPRSPPGAPAKEPPGSLGGGTREYIPSN